MEIILKNSPIIEQLREGQEVTWLNPDKISFTEASKKCELHQEDVEDAERRFVRFAPLIQKYFLETTDKGGLIESPLIRIDTMKQSLCEKYGSRLEGNLLLKEDSHLAIAGSVKARGGIYEVLKHTEDLVKKHRLLKEGESFEKLGEPEIREFFQNYTIQVGSTGNLGLSIGIISAVLGYHVIVHMSADAKQWKKDLLRTYGVDVREYQGDYGKAVKQGRELSDQNPNSYFVDDEKSRDLFLGYSVAGKRLQKQLEELGIIVDEGHPLFVYIPCGVGGAPGGITFGLKQIYGDFAHCFFVEPVQAPCMLLGMATGLGSDISVQDIGLSGVTQADGLAVGRPSAFVGNVMKSMLSGEMTVQDNQLYLYLKELMETERIFLEPSACAAFHGPAVIGKQEKIQEYLKLNGLENKMKDATHIVWATGGSLVPEPIRQEYMNTAIHIEEAMDM
ncbi:MAG: D-serine ammonia-lyase [Lachnospiraceae bacterium]|nr:D-serine ammonia-lyase [Lachnospiraceae bacterium]